jgi:pimeloyl-ACP methyl ester carboxylesterase
LPEADLGDVTIHYNEAGQGNRLALIQTHGMGGSGDSFLAQFDYWSRYFHVISWDMRGLGQSGQASKYNMPLYAKDLAGLMDHLAIKKAVHHGVSWGGLLLQQFGLDYPERCHALIFDSSSSEVNVAASEAWYERGEKARRREVSTPRGEIVSLDHLDSYVAHARIAAGLREHPFTPRLKWINVPSLVVAGEIDQVAPPGGSVIMSRNLPDARLEIVPGSGHGVFHEKPDEFRALVFDFLHNLGLVDRPD